jgi:hypothetical protein
MDEDFDFPSVEEATWLWSDAHSPALHRYGLALDVYEELADEEEWWDTDRVPYEDDEFVDDYETLYEDDQA